MRYLPQIHRQALKLRYVYGMALLLICQRLAIRPHLWDQMLHDAQRMVEHLLTRSIGGNRLRASVDSPHAGYYAEILAPDGAGCYG